MPQRNAEAASVPHLSFTVRPYTLNCRKERAPGNVEFNAEHGAYMGGVGWGRGGVGAWGRGGVGAWGRGGVGGNTQHILSVELHSSHIYDKCIRSMSLQLDLNSFPLWAKPGNETVTFYTTVSLVIQINYFKYLHI